jgi:DNA polymerase sigma
MDYINKNSLKIIEVLDSQRLYFNEIHEKTEIKSKNNILKNLTLLVKKEILFREANKSNTYYSLNYKNQLTLSLLDLLNKEKFSKLPFQIRKSILDSINVLTPKVAILFGSYAKGNYSKESDIDLVFIESAENPSLIIEIEKKYGTKINCISMKFKELNLENESVAHILKTGFPLVGKEYFYDKREI